MISAWQAFTDELARWRDAGREIDFWWRDDDAGAPSAAFERLIALSASAGVPLGLAVIPERAQPALFRSLDARIQVLQHGVDHRNRAEAGERACEFPATEPMSRACARLAAGFERLKSMAGDRLLPVLVPAWNRFSGPLVPQLPALGFRGYSTFGPRKVAEPAAGLRQVNTHVDLIGWRRGRSFVGEERALSEAIEHLHRRRTGAIDATEPTGWLTHHAVHEESLWDFLARLFDATSRTSGVRWLRPSSVFDLGSA